ncbi:MAG: hybrid sensor histidine kinase/response regulator [Thermoleophilia bacterium]
MIGPGSGNEWPNRVWDPEELRRRAMALLAGSTLEEFERMSEADVRALAHELRVHQVELEMQNEELRRALLERDEALDTYTDLYDFAPIGLVTFDVDGRIVEANLTAAALLSVYRGSFVGATLQSFLAVDSLPVFDRFRRSIIATGAKRGCDLEALASDGRHLILRVDGLAYAHGSGSPGRIRAALTDVSTSREMERALRENEEHFRSVVENAGDAIITVDAAGAVVLWNQAAATMFGRTFNEMRGRSLSAIMPEGLQSLHTSALRRAAASHGSRGSGATLEQIGVRADGKEFPVELTLARWSAGSGEFFTGIVRDLSERRRAQEEHERLEEQLRQALKMEAIGRLAGGVAHDMNNMLTPILGYAEILLEDTPETDSRRADLQEILGAATRARDLTRQLLAFARKQTLDMQVLDLNAVVHGFQKMLSRMLRDNVSLELRLAPLLGVVRGDVGQVEQVLLNLVLNAQDALPNGGVISVATDETVVRDVGSDAHQELLPGSYVVMTVSDDGHGMSPEVLEHLFEPFYTSKLKGRGTGLGLATVYGIVKQHGGEIFVQSELDRGSVFRVYLPHTEGAPPVAELPEEGERVPRGTETILIVEDQDRVRHVASQALRRYGYHTLEASSGDNALEVAAAQEGPIHLLLTDVVMPGMNGPELASRLRDAYPGVAVLFMSGYAGEVLGRDGTLDADVELIMKPFSVRDLATRIRRALDG